MRKKGITVQNNRSIEPPRTGIVPWDLFSLFACLSMPSMPIDDLPDFGAEGGVPEAALPDEPLPFDQVLPDFSIPPTLPPPSPQPAEDPAPEDLVISYENKVLHVALDAYGGMVGFGRGKDNKKLYLFADDDRVVPGVRTVRHVHPFQKLGLQIEKICDSSNGIEIFIKSDFVYYKVFEYLRSYGGCVTVTALKSVKWDRVSNLLTHEFVHHRGERIIKFKTPRIGCHYLSSLGAKIRDVLQEDGLWVWIVEAGPYIQIRRMPGMTWAIKLPGRLADRLKIDEEGYF